MILETEAQRIQPFLGPGGWYLYTPIELKMYNRLTGGDRENNIYRSRGEMARSYFFLSFLSSALSLTSLAFAAILGGNFFLSAIMPQEVRDIAIC